MRVQSYGAKTCNDRCRAAAWKAARNYGPHPARNGRRLDTSGLQVSYRKAVYALADVLAVLDDPNDPDSHDRALQAAERILRPALSVRQRAKLDQREQTSEGSST